jgi:RNA polymerase sigma-70 factor (ECF subfamily)
LTLERYHFDADYVRRLTAGDSEVERHFTRYFGDLLTIKLRIRLRSPALVEDTKQETFLRVLTTLRRKGGLATPETLGAFVNSVCNNVLFETYRSQAKQFQLPEEEEETQVAADSIDVEQQLLAKEKRARLQRALRELPEKDRRLLQWLFYEEKDKDEVCRALGVERDYLRVLVHRAKQRFREELLRHESTQAEL